MKGTRVCCVHCCFHYAVKNTNSCPAMKTDSGPYVNFGWSVCVCVHNVNVRGGINWKSVDLSYAFKLDKNIYWALIYMYVHLENIIPWFGSRRFTALSATKPSLEIFILVRSPASSLCSVRELAGSSFYHEKSSQGRCDIEGS